MIYRTGIGYDVHAYAAGRKMVLGGVEFEHPVGLDGHSDADVLVHAIADACLGALGLEDIGHFFPNTDPRWKDVSSLVFLREIRDKARDMDVTIINIDSSVIAEAPKIYPRLNEMKKAVGEALGIPTARVGIKATTNEKMGFVGRGEGAAAFAVASMRFNSVLIE
jgi:2-C-methyl-D-erythritol 2,4-cyclodiphosphate synthase